MKIPKQLRGKKAEKFEDAIIYETYNQEHTGNLCNRYYPIQTIGDIREFYRQPFTPELIELFEGIEKDSFIADIQVYFIGGKRMNLIIDDEDRALVCFGSHEKNPFWQICFTLADFISCCNNSNIELIFKEQK